MWAGQHHQKKERRSSGLSHLVYYYHQELYLSMLRRPIVLCGEHNNAVIVSSIIIIMTYNLIEGPRILIVSLFKLFSGYCQSSKITFILIWPIVSILRGKKGRFPFAFFFKKGRTRSLQREFLF